MKGKDKTRSGRFIIFHQLKAIVEFLNIYINSNLIITDNIFNIIKKVHDDFIETIIGKAIEKFPMLDKKMNFDEILFLTKMYQHTAEAFLTEEERHILLKALDIAEKVKKIVK